MKLYISFEKTLKYFFFLNHKQMHWYNPECMAIKQKINLQKNKIINFELRQCYSTENKPTIQKTEFEP